MMDFVADKPIYRQVADFCTANILSGKWAPEERIPSTKELAVELAVNNRTVMKAYDDLAEAGVIFQRRGMGYYVATDAVGRLRELLRKEFIDIVMPDVIAKMRLAGITQLSIVNGQLTVVS